MTFSIVDPEQGREAYQWHRGFSGASTNVYGRPWVDYEKMAARGEVFGAVDENDDYLGLCYFHFEKRKKAWELGGMMVSQRERGRGIGGVLGRVTMCHVLFEEDPFSRGENIIARVIESNADPRGMLETNVNEASAFKKDAGAMNVPAADLAGVTANAAGYVVGDQYNIDQQVALLGLSEWCKGWESKLKDGTLADIRMRPGITTQVWERAFRAMMRGK
ncbi:MAG: hypothetical protein Q8O67_30455 [Deltaproteobacteria bacterium]|nr:hypothetical protein [Deltaproteobacteria bacterium]